MSVRKRILLLFIVTLALVIPALLFLHRTVVIFILLVLFINMIVIIDRIVLRRLDRIDVQTLEQLKQKVEELEEVARVDISLVKPLMLKLAHLLENADQDAVAAWDTLEKHLEGTCHLHQFKIVKQAIDRYDFEKALLYLRETVKLPGIDLEVKDEP